MKIYHSIKEKKHVFSQENLISKLYRNIYSFFLNENQILKWLVFYFHGGLW